MKTAVITGASRGIGKAIAERFAASNYNLAMISRDKAEISQAAELLSKTYPGRFIGYGCDVRDKSQVLKTFSDIYETFGSIDVIVNNAGVNSRKTIPAADPKHMLEQLGSNLEGWHDELETNLTGPYLCSYIAATYMLQHGSGSIINISSIKGIESTASPGYGASKAALIKLTKDFAKALSPSGLRVNCVVPGFIDTGLTAELPEDKKSRYRSMIPLGRFGSAKEVAEAVFFLASPSAAYITGEILNVDGGYLA